MSHVGAEGGRLPRADGKAGLSRMVEASDAFTGDTCACPLVGPAWERAGPLTQVHGQLDILLLEFP